MQIFSSDTLSFLGFKGEDLRTVKRLLAIYTGGDYPAQNFFAVDSAGRSCVILHFADATDNRDFETFYFRTLNLAVTANSLLAVIDKQLGYEDDDES